MDDENGDVDMDEAFDNMTQMLEGMFGPSPFAADAQVETPEEVRMAILCMKAAHSIDQVADHIEEKDIDFEDSRAVNNADMEDQALVMGVSVLAGPMKRFADAVNGDDDEDNPFKVSDGDDPIY